MTITLSRRVSLVGAGPGSADLITLRGLQRLAEADVVLADALIDPALRAFAPNAQWIAVGKRGFRASTPQAEISRQLVELAGVHRRVVRLKGGDPSLFGRLEEELGALAAAGIPAEVVPGVTAACAAAADAQQPLTRRGRGRAVAFTTAMTETGLDTEAASTEAVTSERATQPAGTEVHYMAGRQLPALSAQLARRGWAAETPVTVVSCAGSPQALVTQHTVAGLASARWAHATRPTVVTVGVGAEPLRRPGAPPRIADECLGAATAA
jgi:uroporphyrin-III C-methyltransferase